MEGLQVEAMGSQEQEVGEEKWLRTFSFVEVEA